MIQVTVQWLTLHLVIVLFIACFPSTKKWIPLSTPSIPVPGRTTPLLDELLADSADVYDDEEAGPVQIPTTSAPPLSQTPLGSYAQEQIVTRPGRSYVPPSPHGSEDEDEDEGEDEQSGLLSTSIRRKGTLFPPSTPQRMASLSLPFVEPPPGLKPSLSYIRAISVISVLLVYFIVVFLVALLVTSLDRRQPDANGAAVVYAGILGLISTFFSAVQFLPQIVHTWREKKVGALSVGMLAMQAPGSFLFVYSLMLQPGTNM